MRELIIDSFAGRGGVSTSIEQALDRYVDIAINHDEAAILMHKTNHPHSLPADCKSTCNSKPCGYKWLKDTKSVTASYTESSYG